MESEHKSNWYALVIAIVRGWAPKIALAEMGLIDRKLGRDEIEEIVELRIEGLNNRQVGDIFDIHLTRVSRIYNKWLKEENKESSEDRE